MKRKGESFEETMMRLAKDISSTVGDLKDSEYMKRIERENEEFSKKEKRDERN